MLVFRPALRCFCPEGVGVGLPTIWREAAVNTEHAVYQEECGG
jgi:hypothetical protein